MCHHPESRLTKWDVAHSDALLKHLLNQTNAMGRTVGFLDFSLVSVYVCTHKNKGLLYLGHPRECEVWPSVCKPDGDV